MVINTTEQNPCLRGTYGLATLDDFPEAEATGGGYLFATVAGVKCNIS